MRKPMNRGYKLQGFTFPEALVTVGLLILFAALGGVLYFQGSTLSASLDRHHEAARSKLELASVLPQLCQSVTPPSWANTESVFTTTAQGIEARYWESRADQKLSIQVEGNSLLVSSPRGRWTWPLVDQLSVGYWMVSGRIVGLWVKWVEGSTPQTLHLAWGAVPL